MTGGAATCASCGSGAGEVSGKAVGRTTDPTLAAVTHRIPPPVTVARAVTCTETSVYADADAYTLSI